LVAGMSDLRSACGAPSGSASTSAASGARRPASQVDTATGSASGAKRPLDKENAEQSPAKVPAVAKREDYAFKEAFAGATPRAWEIALYSLAVLHNRREAIKKRQRTEQPPSQDFNFPVQVVVVLLLVWRHLYSWWSVGGASGCNFCGIGSNSNGAQWVVVHASGLVACKWLRERGSGWRVLDSRTCLPRRLRTWVSSSRPSAIWRCTIPSCAAARM